VARRGTQSAAETSVCARRREWVSGRGASPPCSLSPERAKGCQKNLSSLRRFYGAFAIVERSGCKIAWTAEPDRRGGGRSPGGGRGAQESVSGAPPRWPPPTRRHESPKRREQMMHQPVDYEDPRFYSTKSHPIPAQERGVLPMSPRAATLPQAQGARSLLPVGAPALMTCLRSGSRSPVRRGYK
jgi:hypothetical protein